MNILRKLGAATLLAATLGSAGATMGGCAYGGVATTPDGTVIITRNDLLLGGLLRKVYVCKVAGNALTCAESPTPP
jgi:hypothetical protein